MSSLPPAGWYDDPDQDAYLRYWDGATWTEHRSPKVAPAAAGPARLSDIGSWLEQTFGAIWRRRGPLAILAGVSVVLSWVYGVALTQIWGDLIYIDGSWSGFSAGRLAATVGLTALLAVVSATLYMAMAHQVYAARLGVYPSLGSSTLAALGALPRAVGWSIVVGLAAFGAVVVVVLVFLLSVALGVLALSALLGILVWAAVKLAFLVPSFVVPIEGRNPLQASADVSAGRFWRVVGRLLLLGLITIAISVVANIVTAPFSSTADPGAFDDYVVTDSSDDIVVLDLGGILDEADLGGPGVLVASIPGAITSLIGLAGASVLFAETHQQRPGGPAAV